MALPMNLVQYQMFALNSTQTLDESNIISHIEKLKYT